MGDEAPDYNVDIVAIPNRVTICSMTIYAYVLSFPRLVSLGLITVQDLNVRVDPSLACNTLHTVLGLAKCNFHTRT